ncbi:MAG TPA: ASCH domain-containing protein [Candidatus Margulisiibacteriota bacterium]|nr:ASCH domain-containing protein [Candidatus Margulisiibacteriota bacterium]
MKAITIKQPWAWAIFAGKDIENRSWYTHYRGPLLIHAGAAYQANARLPRGIHPPDRHELEFSAIIGVVDLADVVQRSKSRWFQGDYGFVLRNPRAISPPIPCKGRLGLWTPTETQVRRVKALS